MKTKQKTREFIKIKSRTHGEFYVSFSSHSKERMLERSVNIIEVLSTICTNSSALLKVTGEDMVIVDDTYDLSIVLSVSLSDKNLYYINVITVLDGIPTDAVGRPKFSTNHLIEV